jgi:hypothetical protein
MTTARWITLLAKGRWPLIAGVVCILGLIGGWRLFTASSRDADTRAVMARYAEKEIGRHADLHRAAEAWLRGRDAFILPVTRAEQFVVPDAITRARPQFEAAGLSEREVRAAVEHAAELMHLLFVRRDLEELLRWRADRGYRVFPIDRLRADSIMRQYIERSAGRRLRDDETDALPIWREYWANRARTGRIVSISGVDPTPDGAVVMAWRSTESHSMAYSAAPFRHAVWSRIANALNDPGAPERLRLWRGVIEAVGWPDWFPPGDVEPRLEAAGVQFVEAGWVLRFGDGQVLPFSLVLGRDPVTGRWWVMQYYVFHGETRRPGLSFDGF